MAKAKGIRVNQLAKELEIPSKQILDRLKTEGLGDKAQNHMSLISLGLAETVRQWFAGQGGGVATAVEAATEAAAEARPKSSTRKRTSSTSAGVGGHDDERHEEGGGDVAVEDEPQAPVSTPAAPVAPPTPVAPVAPIAEEPTVVVKEVAAPPAVTIAPEAPVAPTPTPAAPSIAAEGPKTVAPGAPAAPVAKPVAPGIGRPAGVGTATPVAKPPPGGGRPGMPGEVRPQMRPTVSINDLNRKPVTPAPQLHKPAPAKMAGPKVIREEKPEPVAAPRPRRPLNDGPSSAPSFTQARAQGGRGVKKDSEEDEKKKTNSLSLRRRGPDGRRGEADAKSKLREFSEQDLEERRIRMANAGGYRQGFDGHLKKIGARGMHAQAKSPTEKGEPIQVEDPVTVRSLAAALGVKNSEIITKLMRQGVMANVNQSLDPDLAGVIALEYGVELEVVTQATAEEELEAQFTDRVVKDEDLASRPPVVTILGHVDHGKTSLLDKIRNANVAAGEAGGITQHTAAWMVEIKGSDGNPKRVTFIDTPGHQAFTAMRARGANMTDVVVLVVSAAEGVQPQTVESINHARAAEVPIVVAMNKIDRADANPDMVLGQLAANGLNPVEWGGDTEVVRTSATTGQGIPDLIEILNYQSELLALKGDPTSPARGIVIESRIDEGLGPIATVLVQDGTLRIGDVILAGQGYGRIRSLWNDRGESIAEATAAMPVIVSGLGALPGAGEKFFVTDDLEQARGISTDRQAKARMAQLAGQNRVTSANLLETMRAAASKTINLIIKADTQGSIETLVSSVTAQNTEEVKVRVIHSGVGPVSESDVELAIATKGKPTDNRVAIIGFHVVPDDAARQAAEAHHVDVKTYRVIYEIFDDLKKSLSGMLAPEIREKLHGHAEVRQVFKVSRLGNIAGCMVTDGHIQRGSKIRLIRNGAIIVEDLSLESLKRLKDDAKEVKAGLECGIKIAGYDDIKIGDRFEAYSRETIERTL